MLRTRRPRGWAWAWGGSGEAGPRLLLMAGAVPFIVPVAGIRQEFEKRDIIETKDKSPGHEAPKMTRPTAKIGAVATAHQSLPRSLRAFSCFHSNRERTESPTRQKDIAQGYEKCQHLPL